MVVEEGTNSQSQEETFVVSKSDGEVRYQQSLVLGLLSGTYRLFSQAHVEMVLLQEVPHLKVK